MIALSLYEKQPDKAAAIILEAPESEAPTVCS